MDDSEPSRTGHDSAKRHKTDTEKGLMYTGNSYADAIIDCITCRKEAPNDHTDDLHRRPPGAAMHLSRPPRVEDGRDDMGPLPVPLGGDRSAAGSVPQRRGRYRKRRAKGEPIMLFRHAIGRPILIAVLLVVGLAVGSAVLTPFGSGPLGPDTVSADSRCHSHEDHTHGWGIWRRLDAFDTHDTILRASTNQKWHYVDHENSVPAWCFRDENENGEDD